MTGPRIGAKRDPQTGAIINYDQFGNRYLGEDVDGVPLVEDQSTGKPRRNPGSRNVGATPMAQPQWNKGVVTQPQVFKTSDPRDGIGTSPRIFKTADPRNHWQQPYSQTQLDAQWKADHPFNSGALTPGPGKDTATTIASGGNDIPTGEPVVTGGTPATGTKAPEPKVITNGNTKGAAQTPDMQGYAEGAAGGTQSKFSSGVWNGNTENANTFQVGNMTFTSTFPQMNGGGGQANVQPLTVQIGKTGYTATMPVTNARTGVAIPPQPASTPQSTPSASAPPTPSSSAPVLRAVNIDPRYFNDAQRAGTQSRIGYSTNGQGTPLSSSGRIFDENGDRTKDFMQPPVEKRGQKTRVGVDILNSNLYNTIYARGK